MFEEAGSEDIATGDPTLKAFDPRSRVAACGGVVNGQPWQHGDPFISIREVISLSVWISTDSCVHNHTQAENSQMKRKGTHSATSFLKATHIIDSRNHTGRGWSAPAGGLAFSELR
jgi:hypothetical protein